MLAYGHGALESLADAEARTAATPWLRHLDLLLAQAGGFSGDQAPAPGPVTRFASLQPARFDPVPQRDERFPDPYNMGVHAEQFLYDDSFPRSRRR
jgi:hypothetical protein